MNKSRLPSWEDETAWRAIYAAVPEPMQPTEPMSVQEEWRRIGRFDVHLDRWIAPSPKGRVIMLHGGGGHGRLLGVYAWRLALAGYEVVCPDLPSYGLTLTPERSKLVYDDWRDVAAELIKAERQRGGSLFVMGLSMGGMLAYDAAAMTQAVDGLITTCFLDATLPAVRRAVMRYGWMAGPTSLGLRFAPSFFNGLNLPMALLGNMRAIANDPELVRAVIADKRAGGNSMPYGFLRTWLTAKPVMAPEQFETCPVLMTHPANDLWTDIKISQDFFDALGSEKHLVLLENAGHFPVETPGRDQLDSAVVNFMSAITENRPVPTDLS